MPILLKHGLAIIEKTLVPIRSAKIVFLQRWLCKNVIFALLLEALAWE